MPGPTTDRLIHFKSTEIAMSSARDGLIPIVDAVGVVESMRQGQRCDVAALVGKREAVLTVRIAAGIESSIQTGQFVRLEEDGPGGYVAVSQLSPCYDVKTRRFLTHAERDQAKKEMRDEARAASVQTIPARPQTSLAGRLDTPLKRIGMMILALGAVLLAAGLIEIANDIGRWNFMERLFDRWWGSVWGTGGRYERSSIAAWGTYMTVLGYLLSFGYDRLTSRLIRWIRTGSA
ncbi:hypothetical protein [Achromobacter insolitus]|uniref:hypothetical protein n=1 Tax=Achromobacter insolitus TaxID=217204 RepID=UPI0020A5C915|nr:hypothetical protein [Achromobacter insolitus]MCP1404451.1 hypothetical protein [Achromobacter insolitus]